LNISISFVTNFIYENFENVTVTKSGTHFHARCLLCGDSKKSLKKKRFHLQYDGSESIYFHCLNCSESGTFIKLYSLVKHTSIEDSIKSLRTFDKDSLFSKKPDPIKNQEVKNSLENFNHILEDCIDESYNGESILLKEYKKSLLEFKEKRKIPENVNLSIAYQGKYKGRILIKVLDEDKNILYFQGRSISPNLEPKYLNPSFEKSTVIPNIELFINKEKPIIVVEGLIDSFMLGENGTSCLGKEIDDSFLEVLLEKSDKVIIALDNDIAGYKSLIKIIENSKYASQIRYFLFPKEYKSFKDLNELAIKKSINIFEFVLENTFSLFEVQMKLRLEKWRNWK
jgi:hypothetical protein